MVEYKCLKCGKKFNKKSNFENHLKRITPCENKKIKCKYCDKIFTRKDNLTRHIKNMHPESISVKNNINNSNNTNHSNNSHNNIIIRDNNNNNNLTINNNQYFLLPFGTYRLEKDLSIEDRVKIFSSKSGAIETIILKTHLNPKLPQYHNCGITDLHLSYGIIYDGNSWIYKPISDIMHDLITNGQKESYELYEQIKNFIQDDFREEIKNDLNDDHFLLYPEHNKNNKKSKKELIKYLKPNFYNQRELVKTSIKNSGKQVIGGAKFDYDDNINILKDGVTYQDIEKHIQKYKQNKEKLFLKKELATYILDQFKDISHSKYQELNDKINKVNDIKTINIITQLLIQSFCGIIDINKLVLDDRIEKIMEINKILKI